MKVIESKVRISGYKYRGETKDGRQTFIIQHELGRKWSQYLAALFEAGFEDVGQKAVEFEISDNMLIFKINLSGKDNR